MRSKILTILLIATCIAVKAQVPNTTTFTLWDVTNTIYGDHNSGRTLSGCFTSANSAYFDSNYSGSKNSLLNFRNYHTTSNCASINKTLVWGYYVLASRDYVFFTTKDLACEEWTNWLCNTSYRNVNLIGAYSTDWNAGSSVYKKDVQNNDACVPMQDTWAFSFLPDESTDNHVYHIVGGSIVSKETCPLPHPIPQLTTNSVTNITNTTATSGGNISFYGCIPTTGRGNHVSVDGVCWSTSPNPTISDSHTVFQYFDAGIIYNDWNPIFSVDMTGLTPATTYYIRAFCYDWLVTGYGNQLSFTTTGSSTGVPTVTTASPITSITNTNAVGGGTVTYDGGSTVTERGVCWATTSNPTFYDYRQQAGTGTGSFTTIFNDLATNTLYHLRAYAVNTSGVGYGADVTFTTTNHVVTIENVSDFFDGSGLELTGTNFELAGKTITQNGFVYSTSVNPTVETASVRVVAVGSPNFSATITGLNPTLTYYVKAFAVDSDGVYYYAGQTTVNSGE